SDEIAPYLKGEELQIPQMTGDHWFDATRDYMAVSNIDIPVSENITKKIDLGYIPGTLDFGRFPAGKNGPYLHHQASPELRLCLRLFLRSEPFFLPHRTGQTKTSQVYICHELWRVG